MLDFLFFIVSSMYVSSIQSGVSVVFIDPNDKQKNII